jgi:phosphoglycolate phosphatase-like HAD superfamily hydrolase|tara:strand:+ start:89 stop:832 length:744 start_codon:yes stop_codon:yes gene_type:complete
MIPILDFDGVVVDSVLDGFIISYDTFLKEFKDAKKDFLVKDMHELQKTNPQQIEQFRKLRPFLKYGGDYILMHYAIDKQLQITTMQQFTELREQFKDKIDKWSYEVHVSRDLIMKDDLEGWMHLSPPFKEIMQLMNTTKNKLYIASANEKKTIIEMLNFHNIKFPQENIFDCNFAKEKVKIMEHIKNLEQCDFNNLLFIDDQVEHLKNTKHLGIQVGLATWGYCNEQQQEEANKNNIPLLDLQTINF